VSWTRKEKGNSIHVKRECDVKDSAVMTNLTHRGAGPKKIDVLATTDLANAPNTIMTNRGTTKGGTGLEIRAGNAVRCTKEETLVVLTVVVTIESNPQCDLDYAVATS